MKIRDRDARTPDSTSETDLFDRAMRRARSMARSLEAPVLAGTVALGAPQTIGCTLDGVEEIGRVEGRSWVHEEGQRNTEMVSYLGSHWSKCTNPNTRFGPGNCDIYLKLRVRPVENASLEHKEVGIVQRDPFSGHERTVQGRYFTTWDDGDEEWHVKVQVPTTRDYFAFHAYYRDGAFGTHYDDNRGEGHVVNDGPDSQIVQVQTWRNSVEVTEDGVSGSIHLRVADLDYDKQIQLFATTDDWDTVQTFDIATDDEDADNRWYWKQDVYGGELWQIDLDLPGDFDHFEYAVVYRHGVVNDAETYEYWANNGGINYRVERDDEVVE